MTNRAADNSRSLIMDKTKRNCTYHPEDVMHGVSFFPQQRLLMQPAPLTLSLPVQNAIMMTNFGRRKRSCSRCCLCRMVMLMAMLMATMMAMVGNSSHHNPEKKRTNHPRQCGCAWQNAHSACSLAGPVALRRSIASSRCWLQQQKQQHHGQMQEKRRLQK